MGGEFGQYWLYGETGVEVKRSRLHAAEEYLYPEANLVIIANGRVQQFFELLDARFKWSRHGLSLTVLSNRTRQARTVQ